MHVDVVSDYTAFLDLKKEWNELADSFRSPFSGMNGLTPVCARSIPSTPGPTSSWSAWEVSCGHWLP